MRHPHKWVRRSIALAALAAIGAPAQAQTIFASSDGNVTINVESTQVRQQTPTSAGQSLNVLGPGFNVEWLNFQGGDYPASGIVWKATSTSRGATPELLSFLKSDFAGAVYRFGGSSTNLLNWSGTVGSSRTAQLDTYGATHAPEFGVDEFFQFVEAAKGRAIYTLNLYSLGAPLNANNTVNTTNTSLANIKASALKLFEYVYATSTEDWDGDGVFQGALRAGGTRPNAPYKIDLWELGNETDINMNPGDPAPVSYAFDSATYIARAEAVIDHINSHIPQSAKDRGVNPKFIAHALTKTDNLGSTRWQYWHEDVLNTIGSKLSGISTHLYYDGVPVKYRTDIGYVIGNVTPSAPVYITEFAKWPWTGDIPSRSTPGANWPATTSLAGALSQSDFVLVGFLADTSRSLNSHDLGFGGPWDLFTPLNSAGTEYKLPGDLTATFTPRPLAHAYKLLNRALGPADVLWATIYTPGNAVYPNVSDVLNYDVRSAGFRYGQTGVGGAALINRAANNYSLKLTLPTWTGVTTPAGWVVRQEGVGGTNIDSTGSSIWRRYLSTELSSTAGVVGGTLNVPGSSITSLTALGPNLAKNGDLEATGGSLLWKTPSGSACNSSGFTHVNNAAQAINGSRYITVDSTSLSGCSLVQTSTENTALASSGTGSVGADPNASYVLRGNIRTPAAAANNVVRLQFRYGSDIQETSSAILAGKWTPLELEVTPWLRNNTAQSTELRVLNFSTSSAIDVDGLTLLKRQNILASPLLNSASIVPPWATSAPAGTTVTLPSAGSQYVRLLKSSGSGVATLTQGSANNTQLGIGGALQARRGEKWRLRAIVKYNGVGSGYVPLKVRFVDAAGNEIDSTGLVTATALSGNNASWSQVTAEFQPRDIIGTREFSRIEATVQSPSQNGGYIDVRYVALEALD